MKLLDDEAWLEQISPPQHPGYVWRRKRVAGQHLGAGLIELPPGESTFPYHYELGNDELLVVVLGTPTLRTPDGERKLAPGDCVLFPSGPEGAHQITNRSSGPARILLVSNFALPRATIQADSGKLMLRWAPGPDERRLVVPRRRRRLLGRRDRLTPGSGSERGSHVGRSAGADRQCSKRDGTGRRARGRNAPPPG